MPSLSFDSSVLHRPMSEDKAAAGVKILFATSTCVWNEEQLMSADAVFYFSAKTSILTNFQTR